MAEDKIPFWQKNKYAVGVALSLMMLAFGWWIIGQNKAGALTGTVRPDGDIVAQWPACTGAGCASAHYTTVDETSNSTADFVNLGLDPGTGGEIEEYSMTSVAGTLGTVSQVTVTIYAHSNGACEGGTCDDLSVNIRIEGTLQPAQTCTMTTANSICTRTFSGTWIGDEDLQVEITRVVQGGGQPAGRDDDVRLTYVAADVTYIPNTAPAAPTLSSPSAAATGVSIAPTFQLRSTDADNDYLRYRIEVCSTSNCSSVVRTIDQTVSQTGWSGQDTQSSMAYVGSSVITNSTMANHAYQTPALSYATQYWWRAYAIDPGGLNTWSPASSIQSFTTQSIPAAPTLIGPANGATLVSTTPTFQLRSTDADNDYLRYRIEVCSTSNCSSVVRTIDQTISQTGWNGQDAQGSTAYIGSSTLTSSTVANHTYQTPALNYGTQYWWRAYVVDSGGSNIESGASSIYSFTTQLLTETRIQGGTNIRGGTTIN